MMCQGDRKATFMKECLLLLQLRFLLQFYCGLLIKLSSLQGEKKNPACVFQRQCLYCRCPCGGCLQIQVGFKVEYLQLFSVWQNRIVSSAWELFTILWVLVTQENISEREGDTQGGGVWDQSGCLSWADWLGGSEGTRETETTKLLVSKTEALFDLFCSYLVFNKSDYYLHVDFTTELGIWKQHVFIW